MSHERGRRLSIDQLAVLRFAAHRQLARWSKNPRLSPRQRAQRSELRRAVQILQDDAFAQGCVLHPPGDEENVDV